MIAIDNEPTQTLKKEFYVIHKKEMIFYNV